MRFTLWIAAILEGTSYLIGMEYAKLIGEMPAVTDIFPLFEDLSQISSLMDTQTSSSIR